MKIKSFKPSILVILFGVVVFSVFSPLHISGVSAAERVPMIRMYNPTINDHFYTSNRLEADEAVAKHGYRLEGEMGYMYRYEQPNTEPVYRMWNPRALKHFYTTSLDENRSALSAGFLQEGILGFVPKYVPGLNTGGEVGLLRLYNNIQSKHFYTNSESEKDYLLQKGYVWEGYLGGGLFLGILDTTAPLYNQTTLSPRDTERVREAIAIQDAVSSYYYNQPYQAGYDPNIGKELPSSLSQLVPTYLSSIPAAPTPPDSQCTVENNQYAYKVLTLNSFSVSLCLGGSGYYDGSNGLYPVGDDDYFNAGYHEFVLHLSE